jgi:hypothetical protein
MKNAARSVKRGERMHNVEEMHVLEENNPRIQLHQTRHSPELPSSTCFAKLQLKCGSAILLSVRKDHRNA